VSVITIWERWNPDRETYEHNHIVNGFFEYQLIPSHTNEFQRKSWAKVKWKKTKANLIDGYVTEI